MEKNWLLSIFLILAAGWLGGYLSKKIKLPSIFGELTVGIILGPAILGLLKSSDALKILSEIGVIILMVYIGLEVNFKELKKATWQGFIVAIGGFFVPFFLGFFATKYLTGNSIFAVFVALALGITALAVKTRILVDLKLLNTKIAHILIVGALVSDSLSLIIFAGIHNFNSVGHLDIQNYLLIIAKVLGFFIVAFFLGLHVIPQIGKLLAKSKIESNSLYFPIILIFSFGYAELAELAGMHSIIGAFLAGMFIRNGLFKKNITSGVLNSFNNISLGFLSPIFFVYSGFSVTLKVFETNFVLFITLLALAVIGKILGCLIFYLFVGKNWREGLVIGIGMNTRGAVEIIIAQIGLNAGLINNEIFSILVFIAIFTTLTAPILLKWSTQWLKKRGELHTVDALKGFLIVGINPLSMVMAKYLKKQTENIQLIDTNIDMVKLGIEKGFNCIQGNALSEEDLKESNIENVSTVVALTGNSETNLLFTQIAHEVYLIPNIHLLVTANLRDPDLQILNFAKASMMFGQKTCYDEWVKRINSNNFVERIESVSKKISVKEWLEIFYTATKKISLPLFIQNNSNEYRILQINDNIESGEKIIIIE